MTDYYVKNAGDDAKSGLDDTNAWKTISKVNSSSFSGDDNIYFNKGDEWREQLTVPSSGTSGHLITFGAYGSGATPIINGADVMSTWTSYSGNTWQKTGVTTEPYVVWRGLRIDLPTFDCPAYIRESEPEDAPLQQPHSKELCH